MKKKINKKYFTRHGYNRILERSDFAYNEIKNISAYAIKKGLNYSDLPKGPLKEFVAHKKNNHNKKIKLYRGYVFIFFINSKRLITCYPIPDNLINEYKKIKMQKNVKKS